MPLKFKIKNLKLLSSAVVIAFTLLLFYSFTLVKAQVPAPAPIPCTDTGDPEFHSLRPYQASPCETEIPPTAKFCGNELIFHDTIPETYPGNGNCTPSGGKIICTYNKIVDKPLTIDLKDANLPFMGNTEDIPNSQPPQELLWMTLTR